MTLTVKQRTQVNAALCIIHDSGLDAQRIADAANAIIAKGYPATFAYEEVLNAFARDNHVAGVAIGKMTRLIQASDPDTVAKYDHALSAYISTEDDAALLALAPVIATDSIALAFRHWEISATDDPAAAYAMALGIVPGGEPSAVMQQAFAETMAAQAEGAQAAPPVGPEVVNTVSQVSAVEGAGMQGPAAQAVHRYYNGFKPDASPFHGLTPEAAREASRSAAAGEGRGYIPAAVGEVRA